MPWPNLTTICDGFGGGREGRQIHQRSWLQMSQSPPDTHSTCFPYCGISLAFPICKHGKEVQPRLAPACEGQRKAEVHRARLRVTLHVLFSTYNRSQPGKWPSSEPWQGAHNRGTQKGHWKAFHGGSSSCFLPEQAPKMRGTVAPSLHSKGWPCQH